ncbi:MAG TPA: DUF481 domain-containing protein [Gemmatimonadaceae bacterium]|nr:DUF481 domain-containing protein [Gemmatimonadaceae bacterium]
MIRSSSPKGGTRVSQCLSALRLTCFLILHIFLFRAGSAEAQKTDSVWIRNGDRITGEVKSVFRGLLKYSTDDLSTISIEWDKVVRISSPVTFEVQVSSGRKYYGKLGLAPNGLVALGADTLSLSDIVAVIPIRRRFLSRLDGYVDLGASFQKAHSALQLTTGLKVTYRTAKFETSLDGSTFREDRSDAVEVYRLSSKLTQRFLTDGRWSYGAIFGYDQNNELDLAGRPRLVAFVGRTLARSNRIDLRAFGGLVGTLERYFSTDSTSRGLEGLLGGEFSAFRYDHPKLDASIASSVYPSFTVKGRVRAQNDLRVSYELIKDFMLTGTLFDSFDNKPQAEDASKHDLGTTLAISWTF